jgi:hypothetical protein
VSNVEECVVLVHEIVLYVVEFRVTFFSVGGSKARFGEGVCMAGSRSIVTACEPRVIGKGKRRHG